MSFYSRSKSLNAYLFNISTTGFKMLYRPCMWCIIPQIWRTALIHSKKCDYNRSSQIVHSVTSALVSNRLITAFCWIDYTQPWLRYWTLVQIFCLESIDENVQGLYDLKCFYFSKLFTFTKALHIAWYLFVVEVNT